MTWVVTAVVGSQIVGGMMASDAQQSAADTAANAQMQASREGIAEQRRQFDAIQQLLDPFVQSGRRGLTDFEMLAGTRGTQGQQAAIDMLKQTPMFQSQLKLGENRILANASATGGLRGGNTQAALALFAPQLLSQTINDQFGRLGGLISVGQNAAAGVGNAGMQTGRNVSNLLQQGGAAQAGAALAGGRAQASMYGTLGGALGQYVGMGGGFGGIPIPDAVNLGTVTGADMDVAFAL